MAQIDEQDTTRATNDAYTGMLAISLIALIAGCALLYLDYSQYPDKEPPKVKAAAPGFVTPAGKDEQKQQPGAGQPVQIPMPMPMQDKGMPPGQNP